MALPGFTAEVSLKQPRNQYRLGPPVHQEDNLLYPASTNLCYQSCIRQCDDDPFYCNHNCHCECYGIPGRTCFYM